MNLPQCISADVEKYSLPPANDAALHTHTFHCNSYKCVNTTCKNWLTHIQTITQVDHGQSESMEPDSSDKMIVILKTNTHRAIGLVLIINTKCPKWKHYQLLWHTHLIQNIPFRDTQETWTVSVSYTLNMHRHILRCPQKTKKRSLKEPDAVGSKFSHTRTQK